MKSALSKTQLLLLLLLKQSANASCSAGYYYKSGLACVLCPNGTFLLSNHSGYYCEGGTLEYPKKCSAGYYTAFGASSCTICPVGYYCSDPAKRPIMCPVFEYAPEGSE